MGVHGLWKILEPAHRPVKLETLARKRLAVDASIWIYQFLKAVRDSEGNALQNSHIVGFFRRICKLLFHGIRPVFVFDGGAPVLKRQTIAGRKQRREGRREDALQTAKKLLALQVKKRVAENKATRKESNTVGTTGTGNGDLITQGTVYVDQLEQTPEQRIQAQQDQKRGERFKKTDQYQLPEMEHDFSQLGVTNDVRLLSAEELQEYTKQFEGMEDTNLQDYSTIDFASPFFAALPEADRYRILSQARVRSRLRMGYSKEQLDTMFPDRMAFSRFQIDRVARRNEISQRLMNLQGREKDLYQGRVASEKGKEYTLIRNEETGGWSMSFVGNKGEMEGAQSKPIDVEKLGKEEKLEDSDEDEDFEDVPVVGLNRLPNMPVRPLPLPDNLSSLQSEETRQLRRVLYESKLNQSGGRTPSVQLKDDSLFLGDFPDELLLGPEYDDFEDEEELRQAIEMSLVEGRLPTVRNSTKGLEDSIMGQVKDKGKEISTFYDASSNNDAEFQQALAETSKPTHFADSSASSSATKAPLKLPGSLDLKGSKSLLFGKKLKDKPKALSNLPGSLNLSSSKSSLFNKKVGSEPHIPAIRGNEKTEGEKDKKEKSPAPAPPWFSGNETRNIMLDIARAEEQSIKEQREFHRQLEEAREKEEATTVISDPEDSDVEFINVNTIPEITKDKPVILADEDKNAEVLNVDLIEEPTKEKPVSGDDFAEQIKANPPPAKPDLPSLAGPVTTVTKDDSDMDEIEWSESEDERGLHATKPIEKPKTPTAPPPNNDLNVIKKSPQESLKSPHITSNLPSPEPDLSGISIPPVAPEEIEDFDFSFEAEATPPPEEMTPEAVDEAEMLQQMEREAEEHARFAADVSSAQNQAQNIADYERDIKSLRQQQKKDLRDADEVSTAMIQECQQLLKLFGLPYITAPMEAEAQCAELVKLGLVDGIVTDDSDVFLFGGTRVYRHMFNDRHTVQCYLASDLEKEFSLDQHRLIAAAQLLGSDYTEGVPSVGPVTAIELLAEFAGDGGLAGFKAWWTKVQCGMDTPEESSTRFRKRFKRQNVAKVFLPPTFPNSAVEDAYIHPEVDSDPSAFEWGVPDLDGLREFLMNTVGWSKDRTNDILLPVIKDMNKKIQEGTQANITNFFMGNVGAGAFAPRVKAAGGSKRMEMAMERLKEADGNTETTSKAEQQPVRKIMSMNERFAEEAQKQTDEPIGAEKPKTKKRKAPANNKKKKATPAPEPEDEDIESDYGSDIDVAELEGLEGMEEEGPPKKKGRKTAATKRKAPAKKGKKTTK
ncbi:XPG N-terminal domain-containing protein [Pyronema omphalodes]|nr:XPG N-terminal domain-containing protein [Pyronema omphalodes]